VKKIRAAVPHGSSESLDAAVRANVAARVKKIQSSAPVLAPLVRDGKLKVAGAYHSLDTGAVVLTKPSFRSPAKTAARSPPRFLRDDLPATVSRLWKPKQSGLGADRRDGKPPVGDDGAQRRRDDLADRLLDGVRDEADAVAPELEQVSHRRARIEVVLDD
jgi:hypothetical protein